jgi:hypothetical protein
VGSKAIECKSLLSQHLENTCAKKKTNDPYLYNLMSKAKIRTRSCKRTSRSMGNRVMWAVGTQRGRQQED